MSKELKELLENEVLSDGAKDSINEAFNARLEEAKEEAKKELEVDYAKECNDKISEMNEQVQSLVDEVVKEEIAELKEDVRYYADLEVRYAKELETFKEEYAEKMAELTESVIEERVKAEFEELQTDLQEAKKQQFGKEIFEAFQKEFENHQFAEGSEDIKARLENVESKLAESQAEADKYKRELKMNELLSDLTGSKRRVMETILGRVDTDKIEERYNEVIDSVLKEEDKSDSEDKKLDESASDEKSDKEIDDSRVVVESEGEKSKVSSIDFSRDRRLAGIVK